MNGLARMTPLAGPEVETDVLGSGRGERAVGDEVNGDGFSDTKHEIAGVLESPRDKGDIELSFGAKLILCRVLQIEDERNSVVLAVKTKDACNVDLRRAVGRDGSLDAFGKEDDFREFRGFEDLVVHLFIARGVVAIAAGRVHDNFATGFACGGIEEHGSTFHLERAVDGVQGRVESEFDLGVGRIEGENRVLGPGGESGNEDRERERKWNVT